MSSLNTSNTVSPSVDVVGASLPVVTSVGRMPSTLCPASIMTAVWVEVGGDGRAAGGVDRAAGELVRRDRDAVRQPTSPTATV